MCVFAEAPEAADFYQLLRTYQNPRLRVLIVLLCLWGCRFGQITLLRFAEWTRHLRKASRIACDPKSAFKVGPHGRIDFFDLPWRHPCVSMRGSPGLRPARLSTRTPGGQARLEPGSISGLRILGPIVDSGMSHSVPG